jgi:hypothetical protein
MIRNAHFYSEEKLSDTERVRLSEALLFSFCLKNWKSLKLCAASEFCKNCHREFVHFIHPGECGVLKMDGFNLAWDWINYCYLRGDPSNDKCETSNPVKRKKIHGRHFCSGGVLAVPVSVPGEVVVIPPDDCSQILARALDNSFKVRWVRKFVWLARKTMFVSVLFLAPVIGLTCATTAWRLTCDDGFCHGLITLPWLTAPYDWR